MADTTLSLPGFERLIRARREPLVRALGSGELAVLRGKKGLWLECLSGDLWITFEKGGEDHVIGSGSRLRVPNGGAILASGSGSFRLSA